MFFQTYSPPTLHYNLAGVLLGPEAKGCNVWRLDERTHIEDWKGRIQDTHRGLEGEDSVPER
ncbi:UNVERIFIED_CONTAM: hypothetical protein FKN15_062173 [Acipenser sinensis]